MRRRKRGRGAGKEGSAGTAQFESLGVTLEREVLDGPPSRPPSWLMRQRCAHSFCQHCALGGRHDDLSELCQWAIRPALPPLGLSHRGMSPVTRYILSRNLIPESPPLRLLRRSPLLVLYLSAACQSHIDAEIATINPRDDEHPTPKSSSAPLPRDIQPSSSFSSTLHQSSL